MTHPSAVPTPEALKGATFTIRRLGCTAWATGVPAGEPRREFRRAEDRIKGHVIIVENGPLAGQDFLAPEVFGVLDARA